MDEPTLKPGDAGVLEALKACGEKDPSAPRHTLMYFHPRRRTLLGQKKILEALAKRLNQAGWSVSSLHRNCLVVDHTVPVDENSVIARTEWAEQLADDFDVEFDGWECQVNTGTDARRQVRKL